jgi:tight adherence protein B
VNIQIILGWGMIFVASVIMLVLMMLPSHKVSLERRRIGVEQTGAVARIADAATEAAEKFLAGRGNSFSSILEEAGVTTPLKELVVIFFSLCMALFATGLMLGNAGLGVIMAIAAAVAARLWLSLMASRRRAKFESQMDETLQMIAGSLRAGYSLPQAMATIGQEGRPPTSLEFARVTNEVRVGRPMMEALDDVQARMRNEDFFWVTQAIGINREVGGNLADVLDGVTKTIRERSEIKGQVKSLAADGQLSAIILMALPFVVAGFLTMTAPKYISLLITTVPLGFIMLGVGAVMMMIGGAWLYKIINLKY